GQTSGRTRKWPAGNLPHGAWKPFPRQGTHMRASPQPESWMDRYRFILMFWTLVVFYVLVPILHQLRDVLHPGLPPILEGVLFAGVLAGAMISVSSRRAWILFTLSLGLSAMALRAVNAFVGSDTLAVVVLLLELAFLGQVIWAM